MPKKDKFPTLLMVDISLITVVTAYIGARLFQILFVMPKYFLENPMEIFYFWKGGYVIYGAMLFPLIFVYLYTKRKVFLS